MLEPAALPELPRSELQHLVHQTPEIQPASLVPGHAAMPDMQTYTLELVMQPQGHAASDLTAAPQHRVLSYPASDVPEDLSELFGFLREQARPIEPQ